MEILIATHNLAKLARYKKIVEKIPGVHCLSLADLGIAEKVEEIFETSTENARHKAQIYGDLSGKITLAIDEAVNTNFLPDHAQPGVYVRRFSGNRKELTDSEVIEVWKKIFATYPQADKQFIWDFALAFYNPRTASQGVQMVEQISYVAKEFSTRETNGYPMSAFLSPVAGGESYLDMSDAAEEQEDQESFAAFLAVFAKWLKMNNQ
ncbi:MAG: non-canonical purine NTP pyrophosphatase [Parcubacteria group bacterium]|jgi:hypothetical protein